MTSKHPKGWRHHSAA